MAMPELMVRKAKPSAVIHEKPAIADAGCAAGDGDASALFRRWWIRMTTTRMRVEGTEALKMFFGVY